MNPDLNSVPWLPFGISLKKGMMSDENKILAGGGVVRGAAFKRYQLSSAAAPLF